MLEIIKNLPDNVIGLELSGNVSGEDYEKILMPLVEEKLKNHQKIRILYHAGEAFESYDFKAMVDDTKIGMKHITAWERIAVVSDVTWITNAVKAFGFTIPGKIKVFDNTQLETAKIWISEAEARNDISITLDESTGVAILEPHGVLGKEDFEKAGKLIDPYIKKNGSLNGLIIYTKKFPGYDSFGAFSSHMDFVKTHQKHIKKLAIVTDSVIGDLGEKVAGFLLHPEVKAFDADELSEAKAWVVA